VLLGAGLDTFAQRKPDMAARLQVYEVDKPGQQAWKRRRLDELGYGVPDCLHLVPVDFEAGDSWLRALRDAGFDPARPAFVASTGVSMYLTREAVVAMLREVAAFAPGTTLAMTFLLPLDLIDPAERPAHEAVYRAAQAAGTPFLSFFRPGEMLDLAREAGFGRAVHLGTADLAQRYFSGRKDGLAPAEGESMLVATV
jgi:methyltransferase (TIGR00027 family)